MKRNDTGPISVFALEPTDEREVVFDALKAAQIDQKEGVVLVLPDRPSSAFKSPADFRSLTLFKRQERIPHVVFVISKQSVGQWAIANNFEVYPSLEAIVTGSRRSRTRSSQLKTTLISPVPSVQDAREDQSTADESPPAITDEPSTFNSPVTPFPPVNEQFFSQANTALKNEGEQNEVVAPNNLVTTPTPPAGETRKKRKRSPRLIFILSCVTVVATLSAVLLIMQGGNQRPTQSGQLAPTSQMGHLYFLSSGLIDDMGRVGVNDRVEVQLVHLPQPKPGKSYYAWLQSDITRSDGPIVLLGQLTVDAQGNAHLANTDPLHAYDDPLHTNLLATMSQFLVTEEDANMVPTVPSLDRASRLYSGKISQQPNPQDTQNHFSLLDHLRHLLAAEPVLDARGLHGGLSLWLYRNVQKLNELATTARDERDPGLQHREFIRALDYLDGINDVAHDVPAQSNATDLNQGRVLLDTSAKASVGLLQIHAYQNPSSLLQQVGFHLTSLVSAPGVDVDQKILANKIDLAMNNVQYWLSLARRDAQQLVLLSNDQMKQKGSHDLLDDFVNQASFALNGFTDPASGTTQEGVSWARTAMQGLGVIDVSTLPS